MLSHPFFQFLKENQILLILLGILNLIIVYTYVHFLSIQSESVIQSTLRHWQDTPSYLNAMYYFDGSSVGGDISSYLQRMLTAPLMLLSSMMLGLFLGDYATGMFALNVAFYLISIPIFYRIGLLIFNSTRVAFIATILYFTNWGLFSFGPTYLADMGGWFFFLLTTLFALLYYRNRSVRKWFYLGILSSIIGVFFKEYGALGIASLILLTCISGATIRVKFREIFLTILIFGTSLLLYYIWFYFSFHYSYFDWYTYNYESYGSIEATSSFMYSLPNLIKVVTLIFLPGWPLFLLGIAHLWKKINVGTKDQILILAALAPASFAFLIWPAFTHRVAWILVPWAALIAGFGLSSHIKSKFTILCVLLGYAMVDYHVNTLMTNIDLPF